MPKSNVSIPYSLATNFSCNLQIGACLHMKHMIKAEINLDYRWDSVGGDVDI
jgi:hypothetical protein